MTETVTRWTITLPYDSPPLTLNCRLHRMEYAGRTSGLRQATHWLAKGYRIPPFPSVHVVLHWRPATRGRRDPDNIIATLKPCLDGLVDAGIVPDDTPEFVTWSMPQIHEPDKRLGPALWLEITNERPHVLDLTRHCWCGATPVGHRNPQDHISGGSDA